MSLSVLRGPRIHCRLPGPKAAALLQRQRELESSGVWYPQVLPLVPFRVDGPWLEDVDGNVFIDFASMAGALPLGHRADLGERFREQSRILMTALDYPTEPRIAFLEGLADAIAARLSWNPIFHLTGPTGANAVEAALKLARWKTGRPTVIYLEGSFHGMTSGAAGVSDLRSPALGAFARSPDTVKASFPSSTDSVEACVREIERIILGNTGEGRGVAGVILEPVQGEGGVRPLPSNFLTALRKVLDKYEALLIVDEVQTGFGRCGTLFAVERYGVLPDIMAFSKAASGVGAPLAGIAFSKALDGWPPGSHSGTFRGFAPAFAAGVEFLRLLGDTPLLAEVTDLGARFAADLTSALSGCPTVGNIRATGYMIGIDIMREGKPDGPGARRVLSELFQSGLIAELGGAAGNVVRLLPPLDTTRECLAEAAGILTRTLAVRAQSVAHG